MSSLEEPIVRTQPSVRRFLQVCLLVYLVLLVWLVVWKLQVPHLGLGDVRPFKLVPFVGDGTNGSSSPRDVIGNLRIFLPFGVLLGLLAPNWSAIRILTACALTSLALESAQWLLAVGSFDSSDIIMNTAGGAAGLLLLAIAGGRSGARSG